MAWQSVKQQAMAECKAAECKAAALPQLGSAVLWPAQGG